MTNFLIEKIFDDCPCVIAFMPDFDESLSTHILKELLAQGYKDQLVFLDLLLRNGVRDRFFTISLEGGKWNYASCKPVALTREQFVATCNFYRKKPELLDNDCDVLHQAQKYLMKHASDDHLFRNYCYFEKQRGLI